MSEFEAFGSVQAPEVQESDPAADFLAREQDQLAEIEGEDFGFTSGETGQSEQQNTGGEADFFGVQEPQQQDAGDFDPFTSGNDGGASDFVMTGDTEQPTNIPGLDDLDDRLQDEQQAPADPYASVRVADTLRAEPEKIKKWREEQKERLEKKDREEANKMVEWRDQARKELEDWYKHRTEQLDKTQKSNREGEAEFVRERDDTVPGHEWERICRLCEFNPKNSKTGKDVSRMRGILLQLKQNPITKS